MGRKVQKPVFGPDSGPVWGPSRKAESAVFGATYAKRGAPGNRSAASGRLGSAGPLRCSAQSAWGLSRTQVEAVGEGGAGRWEALEGWSLRRGLGQGRASEGCQWPWSHSPRPLLQKASGVGGKGDCGMSKDRAHSGSVHASAFLIGDPNSPADLMLIAGSHASPGRRYRPPDSLRLGSLDTQGASLLPRVHSTRGRPRYPP